MMQYDPENQLTIFSQTGSGATMAQYGYDVGSARVMERGVDQDPSQLQVWIGRNITKRKMIRFRKS